MDFEKLAQQIFQGKQGETLKRMMESETGAKLSGSVDGALIEKAAREGDTQTLSALMKQFMSTSEGQNFVYEVQKAVKKDGR